MRAFTWIVLATLCFQSTPVRRRAGLADVGRKGDSLSNTTVNVASSNDKEKLKQMFNNKTFDGASFMQGAFESVSPLLMTALRGEPISGDMVKEAAAAVIIAGLSCVNPVLGMAATFLWSFLGGGDEEDQLQAMENRIMKEVKSLIRASEFNTRKFLLKTKILDTIDVLERCCPPNQDQADELHEIRKQLRGHLGLVFGDCVYNKDGNKCYDWQTSGGGTEALYWEMSFAQVLLQVGTTIVEVAPDVDTLKYHAELLQKDMRQMYWLLRRHALSCEPYRLSLMKVQKASVKKISGMRCTKLKCHWEIKIDGGYDGYLKSSLVSAAHGSKCNCYEKKTVVRVHPMPSTAYWQLRADWCKQCFSNHVRSQFNENFHWPTKELYTDAIK